MGKLLLVCMFLAAYGTLCNCQFSSGACGEGCAYSLCTFIGCPRCVDGYCRDYVSGNRDRKLTCVTKCPLGEYCHPWLRFCIRSILTTGN